MSDTNRLDDLLLRWEDLYQQGQEVSAEQLCRECPELSGPLGERIAQLKRVGWLNASAETEGLLLCPPGCAAFVPPWPILAGRYRLEERLGEGGFGHVWRGFDLELQRPVAVKLPKAGLRQSAKAAGSVLAEARKVARLKHPGIVSVYDVGQHEGLYFIVSELIDGTDLGERMRRGRLPLREAVRIVAAVADALDYAHRQGIIHRDIKPGNVLLGANGRVYLTDFGIASDSEALPDREGDVCGTFAYMSPEHLGGRSPLDARSDIYSLGVMLCELVTSVGPPHASNKGTTQGPQPSHPVLSGVMVPSFLNEVRRKCVAREPAERYATAKELAESLHQVMALGLEEEEWAACTDPMRMIRLVYKCVLPRKMRLFVCACVRQSYPSIEDQRSQRAVEVAERHADGRSTYAELAAANAGAWAARHELQSPQTAVCAWATNRDVWTAVFNASRHTEPDLQCRLLRELFGPLLYRPLTLDSPWLGGVVSQLAREIYDTDDFDRMPTLADALEEAGCSNDEILKHCRSGTLHVKGCWVLDALLVRD